jgi:hypothetical protein
MRVRVEGALARGAIGALLFALPLAVFISLLPAAMELKSAEARAAYLLLAGPAGAMITHLHTPLLALFVVILGPIAVAAAVVRRWRKVLTGISLLSWFALGAMFASIPLS